jgi:hypothetical protein
MIPIHRNPILSQMILYFLTGVGTIVRCVIDETTLDEGNEVQAAAPVADTIKHYFKFPIASMSNQEFRESLARVLGDWVERLESDDSTHT